MNTCERIDEILNELVPEIKLIPLDSITENFDGIKNEELKLSAEEVKEAIKKVKQFQNLSPKETAENTSNASQKIAKFAKQLMGKANGLEGGKQGELQKILNRMVKDLENGNEELVKSGKNYLYDPENPTICKDLDAACDNLLQILDDAWEEINPSIDRIPFFEDSIDSILPRDIERVGEELKNKANEISINFTKVTPKQLANDTGKAASLSQTFASMLKERAKNAPHSEVKKVLEEAASFFDKKKDELIESTKGYLNDPNDNYKQEKVKSDCEEIKKRVQEVLEEIVPKTNFSTFGSNPGNANPDLIEEAVKEMILSLEEIKKNQSVSPKAVVNSSNNTSANVVKAGDLIKSYATVINNPSLSRVCNNAFRELSGKKFFLFFLYF